MGIYQQHFQTMPKSQQCTSEWAICEIVDTYHAMRSNRGRYTTWVLHINKLVLT